MAAPATPQHGPAALPSRRAVMAGALALGWRSARGATLDPPLRVGSYKTSSPLIERTAGIPDPAYPVSYAEFSSGHLIVEAINAGALDFGSMSEIPPVFALLSGAALRLVAVLKGDVNTQVVLVPRDSPARSVADLKGKRVGYVRATTSQYYLMQMLRRVGLSFADIEAVNLSPADGRAAFQAGRLDAWAIYGFDVPLAIRDLGARVLINANGYLSGNYVFAAHPAALADPARRAAIVDYLGRVRSAYEWADAHHAEWAAAQARVLGLPVELIRAELDNVSQAARVVPVTDEAITSQQGVANAFAEAGLIPRRVDVAPLWDRTVLGDQPARG